LSQTLVLDEAGVLRTNSPEFGKAAVILSARLIEDHFEESHFYLGSRAVESVLSSKILILEIGIQS
jgi:hypothetical protein